MPFIDTVNVVKSQLIYIYIVDIQCLVQCNTIFTIELCEIELFIVVM
jgi:hypothetical protein